MQRSMPIPFILESGPVGGEPSVGGQYRLWHKMDITPSSKTSAMTHKPT
jgi:hypothetical protein